VFSTGRRPQPPGGTQPGPTKRGAILAVPGTTTKNMLISPLEQFNILSFYDFSPFILTGFDMLSNELLFWVHFTIFNNPVLSFGVVPGNPPELSGPPWFHFWVVTHFFVTLETAVLGAFLPFIYSISALVFHLETTAGLTAMATVIDSVPPAIFFMVCVAGQRKSFLFTRSSIFF